MIKGFKIGDKIEKYDYNSLENLPSEETTQEEMIELLTELNLISPITLSDSSILISNNNEIYSL